MRRRKEGGRRESGNGGGREGKWERRMRTLLLILLRHVLYLRGLEKEGKNPKRKKERECELCDQRTVEFEI